MYINVVILYCIFHKNFFNFCKNEIAILYFSSIKC